MSIDKNINLKTKEDAMDYLDKHYGDSKSEFKQRLKQQVTDKLFNNSDGPNKIGHVNEVLDNADRIIQSTADGFKMTIIDDILDLYFDEDQKELAIAITELAYDNNYLTKDEHQQIVDELKKSN